MSRPLPPETLDRMKAAWLAGTTAEAIAADVAAEGHLMTASAVIGRMRRAGLTFMGPRSNWRAPIKPRVRKPRPKKAAAPVVVKAPPPPPAPRPTPRPQACDVVLPESRRVAIWDVRDGQCRWIAGDPRRDSTACGHTTAAGSPYCPAHRLIGTEALRSRTAAYTPLRRAA
ncbi:GcrA family cell cycle regulator [Methylobacterium sp. Leaf94]|uniref:GcrA family cell cycle regulator n=1 Tax=Methylobacterium sp. Leaf94 TaxID=1736250 RepID=UPI00138F4A04|nr:GcrA family cell cycle regulator [Methylobacterium sp. Leaf94]